MNNSTPSHRRPTAAFTLLEVLVVIAILGLLVGLVIGKVGRTYDRANEDIAKVFVSATLDSSLLQFRRDNQSYPTTAEGLNALIARPADRPGWRGPYWENGKLPLDPWGSAYQYASPGTKNATSYDIWSMGPDKLSGTPDDIGNWPQETEDAAK